MSVSLLGLGLIVAGTSLGSFVIGAVLGSTSKKPTPKPEPPPLPPGTMEIDLRYTCHPEKLFALVEQDMSVFGGDEKVEVQLYIECRRGWRNMDNQRMGDIHTRSGMLADALRDVLMDDDSPLTDHTNNDRQDHYAEINAHARKVGFTTRKLRWIDSDSPLNFRLTGRITDVREKQKDQVFEDPAKLAAEKEVDELVRHHAAITKKAPAAN